MSASRLLAIGFIFICTAFAWFALGGSIVARTGEYDSNLARQVAQLWGGYHNQVAPDAWYEQPRLVEEEVQERDSSGRRVTKRISKTVIDQVPVALASSRVDVRVDLDQRRKGLLWYNTYRMGLEGRYRVRNSGSLDRWMVVHFKFPSTEAIYDGFTFRVNGQDAAPASDLSQGITSRFMLAPGTEAVVELSYRSRGLGDWTYAFGKSGVAQVHDFELKMTTDFDAIDFPAGTISPTTKTRAGRGWLLTWRFDSLVTGQKVGMSPPNRLNPGPLASRITFFAPVSLLFFITVLVMLGLVRNQNLHPMNHFFLAAAFFSFHLLLAYLVDHINVHAAFAIASATSLFLVISYLRVVGGMAFALRQAGFAQVVFLVLFSYAFFFEGYTGLTVTVGGVVTLFVLMQLTARVNWTEALSSRGGWSVPSAIKLQADPKTP